MNPHAIGLEREKEFAKIFFKHDNWVHQPQRFEFDTKYYRTSYRPDFYDGERDVFIEVAATRQAYHNAKHRYELFRKAYPLIKFEIRTSDGKLLQEKNGRLIWNNAKIFYKENQAVH